MRAWRMLVAMPVKRGTGRPKVAAKPPRSESGRSLAVLRALVRGPMTVAEIAAATDLSEPSAYRTLQSILETDLPVERTERQQEMGRPSLAYELPMAKFLEWLRRV